MSSQENCLLFKLLTFRLASFKGTHASLCFNIRLSFGDYPCGAGITPSLCSLVLNSYQGKKPHINSYQHIHSFGKSLWSLSALPGAVPIPGEAVVSQADPVCLTKRLRDNRGHKSFSVGAQGTEEAHWRGTCRG